MSEIGGKRAISDSGLFYQKPKSFSPVQKAICLNPEGIDPVPRHH